MKSFILELVEGWLVQIIDINVKTAGTVNGVTFSANIDGEFEFEDGYQVPEF